MEISIDEIIEELEDSKDYPASDPASDEALGGAIAIMRKYQRIEEIVSNYGFDTSWLCLKKIREVMEDGNDD